MNIVRKNHQEVKRQVVLGQDKTKLKKNKINKEGGKMILHQQAPTPEECQKPDGSCHECKFFKQCRDFVLNRHEKSSKSIREIESEARQNSLGGLAFEERSYSPD